MVGPSRTVIAVSVLFLVGCAHPTERAARPSTLPATDSFPSRDTDVLEAALRDRLQGADARATFFISIGSLETKWKDPPPELMKRLRTLPCTLKPVSQARLPKGGEMDGKRFRGVEDPATGKRTRIYWAEIKEWISDSKVRLDVGGWTGPLDGGGGICVFEQLNGVWEFTEMEEGWSS